MLQTTSRSENCLNRASNLARDPSLTRSRVGLVCCRHNVALSGQTECNVASDEFVDCTAVFCRQSDRSAVGGLEEMIRIDAQQRVDGSSEIARGDGAFSW